MERTREQKKAIALHGCNILVAAAAGSGKTSVLIERILTMVSDLEHPVDIDRLLVVTFTNAAAAEMRERMEHALEEKFEQHPDNRNLQKQMTLLHRSHIMTIDSFCAEVLRNHFQEIDLDPSFRIADNTELKLLQEDVLSDVLEGIYQEPDSVPGFLQFMDSYAPGRSDEAAETVILSVYQAASAYPDPEGWIREKREEIAVFTRDTDLYGSSDQSLGGKCADTLKPSKDGREWPTLLDRQLWMKKLLSFLKADLESCSEEVKYLLKLCESEEGMEPYRKTLESDRDLLERISTLETYQEYAEAFFALSFERLGRIKKADKEQLDPELVKAVKDGRDAIKTAVSGMKENYFPGHPKGCDTGIGQAYVDEICRDLEKTAVPMLAMYDTVLMFMEAYRNAKKERNILDFSDQEHLALKILVNSDGTPTGAALEMREFFEEIFIDEYQDSNRLQEVILSAISRGNNMFMVGDVKQSIYRFRLARPELFMEKYQTYADCNIDDTFGKPEGISHKIDLSRNFRSRKSVLATVNYLFSRIMGAQVGEIEYDKAAALYYGAGDSYAENSQDGSEILLITPKEAAEEEKLQERGKIELEAAHIASKIKELKETFMVRQGTDTRPLEYGDIAILLRTMSGWSETFLKTLQESGIPAVTATAKGYFEATEIQILLNLLKIIDNGQQDIPLAAVMLSPIGNFNEEELSIIKGEAFIQRENNTRRKREDTFYHACMNFLEREGEETQESRIGLSEPPQNDNSLKNQRKLQEKLNLFFMQIDRFRNLAACLPVPELIEQILMVTGFDSCVRAMPDGEKRYGNVRMLIKKAGDFEKTSYHGLFQFNRYMERLKKYEIDFGEADHSGAVDAVRIMSIHKSKGLEFPVVFVAGLGKQFNLMDARKNIVVHQEFAVGADYVDLDKKVQVPTVMKKVLQKDMLMEMLAEELRVLYVAMTRAEEKLILTGYVEKPDEKEKKWSRQGSGGKLSVHVIGSAKTFLDLVMPVFLQKRPPEESQRTGFDDCPMTVRESNYLQLLAQASSMENTREWKRQELLYHQREAVVEEEEEVYYREIFRQMEEGYPYETAVKLKTKFTVSELKRAFVEEWEEPEDNAQGAYLEENKALFSWGREEAVVRVPDTDELLSMKDSLLEQREKLIPSFIKSGEEKYSSVVIGTLYHKILQRLDFVNATHIFALQKQMEQWRENGILTEEELSKVSLKKLWKFISSPIGKRIANAQNEGHLYREQPFVMGVNAAIFAGGKTDQNDIRKRETDIVLVQGVIDLFFEENGKIVLLDYKTDRIQAAEQLKERYHKQLEYYEKALIQTRNMPVEEKYLYSFCLGELVPC